MRNVLHRIGVADVFLDQLLLAQLLPTVVETGVGLEEGFRETAVLHRWYCRRFPESIAGVGGCYMAFPFNIPSSLHGQDSSVVWAQPANNAK